jgi:integrase/recombinase XerD
MADRSRLRGRRRLPRPICEQHEQRALDAAIGAAPQPYRLIFTVLRETGMRLGEALELRWGDVTLEKGAKRSVSERPRMASSAPSCWARQLRLTCCAGCVRHGVPTATFPRITSCCSVPIVAPPSHTSPCTTSGPSCARWLGCSMPPGLPATHQLRHTRGSDLIAQGHRVEIVQRVLGPRDIRSTLGYAELQETHVRAAWSPPPCDESCWRRR